MYNTVHLKTSMRRKVQIKEVENIHYLDNGVRQGTGNSWYQQRQTTYYNLFHDDHNASWIRHYDLDGGHNALLLLAVA